MELPDFREFEAFNTLRERMGADRLGYFEAFDPARHLTGEARLQLQTEGITVTPSDLWHLGDHTLAYRNSRVALLVNQRIHVTRCREAAKFASGTVVSTDDAIAHLFGEEKAVSACPDCLHQLRFQRLDLSKERRQRHNEDLLRRFRLADFFAEYPDYPLYERTHVRHPFSAPLSRPADAPTNEPPGTTDGRD